MKTTMKTTLQYATCGVISGAIIGHYGESLDTRVNFGHRKNISSPYHNISKLTIFSLPYLLILPFVIWVSPGIYLNAAIDRLKYPDRWHPDYKSPGCLYIESLERLKKAKQERQRYKQQQRGRGGGIPQCGKFF